MKPFIVKVRYARNFFLLVYLAMFVAPLIHIFTYENAVALTLIDYSVVPESKSYFIAKHLVFVAMLCLTACIWGYHKGVTHSSGIISEHMKQYER